jgi:hypothetical protein
MHKLSELDAIFIVKGDERHNQIGAGLTALAALSMTVAAGRIVERKAAIDGIGRIDDESRTSATPSASAAATTAALSAGRRLSGRRLGNLLGLDDGN